jgi:hypothetical protein
MKYKVIAKILDGAICATRCSIICYDEDCIRDVNGEDRITVNVGDILTSKQVEGADFYWYYSKQEWDKMDKAFRKIQKTGV